MNRLIEQIERLLFKHDCVIIPDFGGFVLQTVSAVYDFNENTFAPSRKEIVFNPTLTHNDGLLVESYMQESRVDYVKAQILVKNDIADMKASLESNSELHFGSIGYFVKEEDRIVFSPDEKSGILFSLSFYGLPTFHYLPLSSRGAVAPLKVADSVVLNLDKSRGNGAVYIPVARIFVRSIAMAAAAILLFLLVSTPVRDVNKASYSASFIPQEIMPKKISEDIAKNAFADNSDKSNNVIVQTPTVTYSNETDSVVDSASSVEMNLTETLKTTPNVESKPEAKPETKSDIENTTSSIKTETKSKTNNTDKSSLNAVSVESSNGIKYYVIIGSFDTRTQAKSYIRKLKGMEASTAGIVVSDGHVRVYSKYFENENSAQSYLKEMRQSSRHKQAWMYKGK